ncbi:ABC transporter permease [Haloarchaeobius sp. HRN-SO-5]|uniref:ABC transporter permease n=1 Tax=Haloarchaeobius sp. HRN-SO-5 TaxID=3446118 RepID=UPI003EBE33A5
MRWTVVARRDWRQTVGATSTKVLLGLVGFTVLLAGYVYPVLAPDPITTARFSGFVIGSLTTLVPLVGILLGYNAVVGERESGSLLLSLALPLGREDVVLGKYASRTGLLAATIVVAMAGAGALVVYPFGELALLPFLGFVLLSVLFGAIWTGMGVAVSLAVSTKRRALVLGSTLFFLFVVVMDVVEGALTLGLYTAGLVEEPVLPDPIRFLVGLEPGRLFGRLTTGFVDPSSTIEGPWYLGEWVALVLFALWLVGPLGLAYLRFEGRDLA